MSKEKNQQNLINSFHEISFAEFGSAIEMLQAAKNAKEKSLAIGFLKHSLDEYRHTKCFRLMIKMLCRNFNKNERDFRFIPNHVAVFDYVNTKKFIFEQKDLGEFSVFLWVNESSAKKFFKNVEKKGLKVLGEKNCSKQSELDVVATKELGSLISENLHSIINDEQRHAELARGFSIHNLKKHQRVVLYLKESVINFLRRQYASNTNRMISKILGLIVYFLVILLCLPLRGVFLLANEDDANLITKENSSLMI